MSEEQRARLDALREEMAKAPQGGYENFLAFSDLARKSERLMYEMHHCYGKPYSCISCGCSKGRPCVSHKGSDVYRNELLGKIAYQERP